MNEKHLKNNPDGIIKGGNFILQHIIPKLYSLYHAIQDLIVIWDLDDELYSKSVAVKIVQKYPKGSSGRAALTKALLADGAIPSERSMQRLLQQCETVLDSGVKRPIIDQRWDKQGGSKPKWEHPELVMDLYPIQMKVTKWKGFEELSPIITLDLFSTARRTNVCDYLNKRKDIRLYFCPKQFRVPLNLKQAWETTSFKRLKWFIEQSSLQGNNYSVKYKSKCNLLAARQ